MARDSKANSSDLRAAVLGFPRQLIWKDFGDAPPNEGSAEAAQTAVKIKLTSWGLVFGGKFGWYLDNMKISVTTLPSGTWVTASARGRDDVLLHEQGHFDIQGLLARDMAARLLDIHIEEKELNKKINAEFARSIPLEERIRHLDRLVRARVTQLETRTSALVDLLQDNQQSGTEGIYDADTEHGTNNAEQRRWSKLLGQTKASTGSFEATLLRHGLIGAGELPR